MQYAVPRILAKAGLLNILYTDIYASNRIIKIIQDYRLDKHNATLKRLILRNNNELNGCIIRQFPLFGLEYYLRLQKAKNETERTKVYLWAGRCFCRLINENNWGLAKALYTFNSAGYETMVKAKEKAMACILEQTIAPYKIVNQLIKEEREMWPGWEEDEKNYFANDYSERERAEWRIADRIICGSEYVRNGLIQCGVNPEKCTVIPYGVKYSEKINIKKTSSKLHVLTVGTVCLRKGIPYLLEAAKVLSKNAEFKLVGPLQISRNAQKKICDHVHLVGAVPHSEIERYYRWADVFLLPSICEGSATVTYEAMSYGLPIICTPNTGSIVRNMIDGFIVPIRNKDKIVEVLEIMSRDRKLCKQMGENAMLRAKEYDYSRYNDELIKILKTHI
ncbi:MAG: glycosyltransferase family 4 protein [Verrucomicrobiae bacterium]|nr:glycosyltransferase family 4 protein [Verrucomicrobiae bacterium]